MPFLLGRVVLLPFGWRRRSSGARAVAFARPRPRHVGRANGGPAAALPRPSPGHARPRRVERDARRLLDCRARPGCSGDRRRMRGAALRFLRPVARGHDRTVAGGSRPGPCHASRPRQHHVPADRSAADGGAPPRRSRRRNGGGRGSGDGPVLFAGRARVGITRRLRPRGERCCRPIPSATPAAARPYATWTRPDCCPG